MTKYQPCNFDTRKNHLNQLLEVFFCTIRYIVLTCVATHDCEEISPRRLCSK